MLRKGLRIWTNWRLKISRRNYFLGAFIHVLSIIFTAFILVFVFTIVIMQPYQVDGKSMHPTLDSGDRLFVWRTNKLVSDFFRRDYVPKRGQIVIFQNTETQDKWVKRVIGLPNERVVIRNNNIIIYNQESPNGFILKFETSTPLPDFPPTEPIIDRVVGPDEVFVLGDNRNPQASSDSRHSLGNVPLENIDGVVFIRVIPLQNFSIF